ncbi:hypothetical protein VE03_04187 [Pseudogymnoascus sp. 23342-1-I1]|nr:hypothetical protein VE03_04187 [Pseudogymnoascus sp. 23342-1-I1]
MKFLQPIIVLFFLITFAQACLTLDGKYTISGAHPRQISATLTDNGRVTCRFSGIINEEHYFANCNPTFASYIHSDLTKLAYSNSGKEYLIDVQRKKDSNNFETYYRISARAFALFAEVFSNLPYSLQSNAGLPYPFTALLHFGHKNIKNKKTHLDITLNFLLHNGYEHLFKVD